jgi:hypothetical protein
MDIGTGDWGLGRDAIGAEEASAAVEGSLPSPQSPVPSPQSLVPVPRPHQSDRITCVGSLMLTHRRVSATPWAKSYDSGTTR